MSHAETLSAIVLAAGESKRMQNKNKLLLPFKSKTVIRVVVENVVASGVNEVIVVLGHEAEKVKTGLAGIGVQFVLNKNYEKGMTTSIQEGVKHASGKGYMICLSDMVMITSEEYMQMKNEFLSQLASDERCICIPRYKNEKGNPVVFSSVYRDDILHHEEMEGCKGIVRENQSHIHWIEMNTPNVLRDMDSPGDYEHLKENEAL